MSTNWDVYCIDCDDGMGLSSWNHAEDAVNSLCHAAALLADLSKLDFGIYSVEFALGRDRSVDLSFFEVHRGHRLRPRSEYGEILGTCAKRIACVTCGHDLYEKCRREPGHPGECAPPVFHARTR